MPLISDSSFQKPRDWLVSHRDTEDIAFNSEDKRSILFFTKHPNRPTFSPLGGNNELVGDPYVTAFQIFLKLNLLNF